MEQATKDSKTPLPTSESNEGMLDDKNIDKKDAASLPDMETRDPESRKNEEIIKTLEKTNKHLKDKLKAARHRLKLQTSAAKRYHKASQALKIQNLLIIPKAMDNATEILMKIPSFIEHSILLIESSLKEGSTETLREKANHNDSIQREYTSIRNIILQKCKQIAPPRTTGQEKKIINTLIKKVSTVITNHHNKIEQLITEVAAKRGISLENHGQSSRTEGKDKSSAEQPPYNAKAPEEKRPRPEEGKPDTPKSDDYPKNQYRSRIPSTESKAPFTPPFGTNLRERAEPPLIPSRFFREAQKRESDASIESASAPKKQRSR